MYNVHIFPGVGVSSTSAWAEVRLKFTERLKVVPGGWRGHKQGLCLFLTATFMISAGILSGPVALLFFRPLMVSRTSVMVGGTTISCSMGLWGMWLVVSGSVGSALTTGHLRIHCPSAAPAHPLSTRDSTPLSLSFLVSRLWADDVRPMESVFDCQKR